MRSAPRQSAPCILLPTDFQQPARRAFTYGVKLALVLKAQLEIVHVIKTISESREVTPGSRYLHSLRTSALLELGRLTGVATEAGVRAEPRLLFGSPVTCILEAASRPRTGLIVMGTHGRTGWDRLRLGSAAEAVVREARCPVLTLQEALPGDTVGHRARVSLDRLLVATDFSVYAEAALRYVVGLARQLKAKISVVHVSGEGIGKRDVRQRLTRLMQECQRKGIEAEWLCIPGDPIETILSQAALWQADLIAVGTQGRRGLSRLVLGSVAEGVLRRAGCPVLVVKSPARRSGRATGEVRDR